ncbi:MAG: thiamine phosphate synthase [Betaproteobacteria bacterium]
MIRIQITQGSAEIHPEADFVQIREPHLTTRDLASLVRRISAKLDPGVPRILVRILVNDRADVAIASGAAGVHLRDHAISPRLIRRIAPPGFIVTVACHDADAVRRAEAEGADYALLAPIFAPLSTPLERPPLGLAALRQIVSQVKIPVIALGGITAENTPLCIEAGAAGIAGITMFQNR